MSTLKIKGTSANEVTLSADANATKISVDKDVDITGKVRVFVPAAAGTSIVICPELLPLITNEPIMLTPLLLVVFQ